MDRFDELHVISDLHLGGDSGHQIFRGAALLGDFIQALAGRSAERTVALVINGDFIDFLAGNGATYFDPQRAPERLAQIARDFSPVFEGLRKFVATPNRHLVIVLGNHDIELALPNVQRSLLSAVAGDTDPAARGRVLLSVGGAGFAARVGSAQVVCLHGNEVDPFNITDYETLRRAARDQVYGWSPKPWIPNAGTKLVIEIMNGIKQSFPFIDLLKPETDAVVPLLFALDQASVSRLLDAIQVASRVSWDTLRKASGFLSMSDASAGPPLSRAELDSFDEQLPMNDASLQLSNILRRAFETPRKEEQERFVVALLDRAEERFQQGIDPIRLARTNGDQKLGFFELSGAALRAGWAQLLNRPESERLRAALRHLLKDKTFDRQFRDADFERIDEIVPVDVNVVVAGHTHLERKHPRRSGGTYINTGTWARLMRLTPELLNDATQFSNFYDAVRKPTIEALDDTGFVLHRPSVASIIEQGGTASAHLCHVQPGGGTLDAPEGAA
jgi:UDP-2,3-diacylglucosamine pyrophosphatase LpxH